MYRYVFNPYSCRWEIQLLRWGFFWRTLRGESFNELGNAVLWAKEVGISQHYQEQRPFNHNPVTEEQSNDQ